MHQLPNNLPVLIQALAPYVENYGYFAVGLALLLEDFGLPVPGETMLVTAAFFAGIGRLDIGLVIVVGFAAAVLGDNIGFSIGNYGGKPLVARWGKYVFLTAERLDKAHAFFNRHGGKIVIVARFIEGLRQLNGIIAGISDMPWHKFLFFNVIGAALWVTFWGLIGFYGGSHIELFHKYSIYFSIIGGAVIIGYVAYLIYKIKFKASR